MSAEKAEYRDVFWCRIVNEPGVIEYVGEHPKCVVCGMVDTDSDGSVLSEGFKVEHVFCCNVIKPKRA